MRALVLYEIFASSNVIIYIYKCVPTSYIFHYCTLPWPWAVNLRHCKTIASLLLNLFEAGQKQAELVRHQTSCKIWVWDVLVIAPHLSPLQWSRPQEQKFQRDPSKVETTLLSIFDWWQAQSFWRNVLQQLLFRYCCYWVSERIGSRWANGSLILMVAW